MCALHFSLLLCYVVIVTAEVVLSEHSNFQKDIGYMVVEKLSKCEL